MLARLLFVLARARLYGTVCWRRAIAMRRLETEYFISESGCVRETETTTVVTMPVPVATTLAVTRMVIVIYVPQIRIDIALTMPFFNEVTDLILLR